MVSFSSELLLRPYLGPWSCCSWGLCWCSKPMLPLRPTRSKYTEIWGSCWVVKDLLYSCCLLQWESRSHPKWKIWPWQDPSPGKDGPTAYHRHVRANLKHGICPYQRHGHKKNWLYPSSEVQSQWRHQRTYWTSTQAHTLWFELAHHNIHTVWDLLEHEKTDSAETELQNPHDSGK